MGIGPIPISKIWDWEAREGIDDPVMRDHVEAILMGVDALVCKRMRAEGEAKTKTPPPPANRPPGRKRRR
jgi:hypothetical protein